MLISKKGSVCSQQVKTRGNTGLMRTMQKHAEPFLKISEAMGGNGIRFFFGINFSQFIPFFRT